MSVRLVSAIFVQTEFASSFQGMCFLLKVIKFLSFANNTRDTAGISWSECQVESKSFNTGGFKVPHSIIVKDWHFSPFLSLI